MPGPSTATPVAASHEATHAHDAEPELDTPLSRYEKLMSSYSSKVGDKVEYIGADPISKEISALYAAMGELTLAQFLQGKPSFVFPGGIVFSASMPKGKWILEDLDRVAFWMARLHHYIENQDELDSEDEAQVAEEEAHAAAEEEARAAAKVKKGKGKAKAKAKGNEDPAPPERANEGEGELEAMQDPVQGKGKGKKKQGGGKGKGKGKKKQEE